jgi:type I restriction enzyme S subunit
LALQKYPVVEGEPTLPILKISQLRAGRTDPKVLSNRKMKSEFIVKDGDIIFSWSGSLEVRIWTGGDAALNQHLFKVFSEKHPAWFCYQATQHHLPSFRETAASKATTMGHIQRRHLSEAKVAVCPPSLMAKLNDIFVPMQKTVVLNGQLIREIEQLRDHLLPRLISGKLSIGEAEKAVAELLPEPVEAI